MSGIPTTDYVPTIKTVLRSFSISILFLVLAWVSLENGYLGGPVLFGVSTIVIVIVTVNRVRSDLVKIKYKYKFDSSYNAK
jgi:hypothetical protein